MEDESASRQLAEIEALQAIYAGEGEFELLEEPQTGAATGASFRVRCPDPVGSLLVALPAGYPAAGTPSFVAEELRGSAAAALQEGLVSLATARVGEECVFEVLSSAAEVAESAGITCANEAAPAAMPMDAVAEEALWWRPASDGAGALLRLSVRSGPKVKTSQVTNLSELRRVANAGSICVDLAPSRNTENYELAALLASCLQTRPEDVEFIVGGRKEKATGERQALIRGMPPNELSRRLFAGD